ncbi:MAG: type III-A CRISPR-associated RAMP protein Csm4 [Saprospiraceae bacterium]|nr:type III-A CRISPR-associated RAMP protein Csm4 [Saprospiraceae bacterium]
MKLTTVHFRFRQPVHFSRGKMNTYESSDGVLHSDTIQAALYVAAMQLYGQSVADQFKQRVRISSAFPYTPEGYWLPKPLSFNPDDSAHRKELKKIRYLRAADFEQLLNGNVPAAANLLVHSQPEIWIPDTTQRVLLDRIDARGVPFYLEKLYPVNRHSDRGLYVIVQEDGDGFPQLESLFRLLADNGIGLQRGLGNGVFDYVVKKEDLDLNLPQQAHTWTNLSLFRPSKEDVSHMKLDDSYYQLLKRGGWIASPEKSIHSSLRKKSVVMFSEGSVLTFDDMTTATMTYRGEVEDLQPVWTNFPHPVWRDGRGIFLPMALSKN